MKTLIETSSTLSKYLWADNVEVFIEENFTTTPNLIIGDMKAANAILVTNVTPPNDWAGNKYFYSVGTWTLNPQWVDPTQE